MIFAAAIEAAQRELALRYYDDPGREPAPVELALEQQLLGLQRLATLYRRHRHDPEAVTAALGLTAAALQLHSQCRAQILHAVCAVRQLLNARNLAS